LNVFTSGFGTFLNPNLLGKVEVLEELQLDEDLLFEVGGVEVGLKEDADEAEVEVATMAGHRMNKMMIELVGVRSEVDLGRLSVLKAITRGFLGVIEMA
jgi:hypothetical protein